MVKMLEKLDVKKMSDETKAEYERSLNYLRGNVERMKYPEYLKYGWQIATGAIESACKTVVNQRLCMGGMRRVNKAPTQSPTSAPCTAATPTNGKLFGPWRREIYPLT
ncbi:MAG: hypothetical protein U0744_15935 [Gemmataceae bacterium]